MSFIPNAAAFAFTAVACVPVLKLLRGRAIVDVPNHRSSHTVATATVPIAATQMA